MAKSTKVAPPNSLVLIADVSDGDIPRYMRGAPISSTESCVAVGCRSETDGETEITLGASKDVDPGGRPDFDGFLKTPSRRIVVRSVVGQAILDASVSEDRTRLRVWVNDPQEPDRIVIGFA